VSCHDWTRSAFLDYMRTWSAYRLYVAAEGHDPMPELDKALSPIWPEAETKLVSFDLFGRIGRVETPADDRMR
jgi:hypothetical protein